MSNQTEKKIVRNVPVSSKPLSIDEAREIAKNRDSSLFGALRMGLSEEQIGLIGTLTPNKESFKLVETMNSETFAKKTHTQVDVILTFSDGSTKPLSMKIQSPDEMELLIENDKVNFKIGSWGKLGGDRELPRVLLSGEAFQSEEAKVKAEHQRKLDGATNPV